ncbi:MAG: alanine dehydrogenase [Proteobacteria bacterium]|nr:alanine dehydrogenase [Pseudomonadota bacterium]
MRIGMPKEIKDHEYRVGLVPSSVRELVANGHEVLVETNAGIGIDINDEVYRRAGAIIVDTAAEIYESTDLIIKVKEPQPKECLMMREEQVIFAYLHLAPDPSQAKLLLDSGCVAIAFETVTDEQGRLPLLAPMSEVAGRMSIQAGAHALEKAQGGRGILLGGVTGVAPGHVVVLGGGVVGTNAIRMAVGMEAEVTVLDKSLNRLRELDNQFGSSLHTIYATQDALERYMPKADLVIGAVLVPGGFAPKLVSRSMLLTMKPGTVLVDVAIDQGGCFETSMPTTHTEPTYIIDGIIHYCVTNMPGGVPRTSSFALNNATLPYVIDLANKGYKRALLENTHLRNGLNIHMGKVTHNEVARALGLKHYSPLEVLNV